MNRKKAPVWGLFYRELVMSRNGLCSMAVISVIFLLMSILTCISIKYGNLRMFEDIESVTPMLIYTLSAIFMLIGATGIEVSDADIRTDGWETYIFSSPVSIKRYYAVKYGLTALLSAAGMLIACIWTAVMCAANGLDFSEHIPVIFVIFAVLSLLSVFMTTLSYITGSSVKAAALTTVITIVVFYVVLACCLIEEAEGRADKLAQSFESIKEFVSANYLLAVPFSALVIFIGYSAAAAASERRKDRKIKVREVSHDAGTDI